MGEMELLAPLERFLHQRSPEYEVTHYQAQKFLKVTKFLPEGLKYLPNFHLVFQVLDNESLSMRILTYHGRTLSTFIFNKFEDGSSVPGEVNQALEDLSSQKAHLCPGVDRTRVSMPMDHCLVEYFNDEIIARSAHCVFLIDKEASICKECEKLIKVKTELEVQENTVQPHFLSPKQEVQMKDENNEIVDNEAFEELDYEKAAEMQSKVDVILKDEYGEYDEGEEDEDWDPYVEEEDYGYQPPPRKKKKSSSKSKSTQDEGGGSSKKRGRPKLSVEEKEERAMIRALRGDVKIVPDGSIKCKICLKVTATKNALGHHMKVHRMYFDTKGSMSCPLCKETIEKLELTTHFQQVHSTADHPQTCCLSCLEVFPNDPQHEGHLLREHINKSHQQQNVCEICGKVFKGIKSLECHVKVQHFPDTKEFFCDRCGKGFSHEIPLRKHVKFACAMEEWKCEFCSKIFTYRQRLRYHLMVHCEEKPYACKLCGYRSYKADNLSVHVKKSHHLKGVKADFFTLEDVLQRQTKFLDKYLAGARIK